MKNTEQLIEEMCDSMKELLLQKNRSYGDSATNPSNVFSKGSPVESICARIDDKLMRIQNKGINDETEDTVSDLIGYLILLKVALHKEKNNEYNIHITKPTELTIMPTPFGTVGDLIKSPFSP